MRSALVVVAVFVGLSCATQPVKPPPKPQPVTAEPDVKPPVWSTTPDSPETPVQAAIRIWELEHGKASAHCANDALRIQFRILDDKGTIEACGRHVAACMEHYDWEHGGRVVINREANNGLAYSVRVHETLHVLIWCAGQGATEANQHLDLVWRHVPQDELPEDSPWHYSLLPAPLKSIQPPKTNPPPGSVLPPNPL